MPTRRIAASTDQRKTGAISHGVAKYLRDALPNASFIAFTGTPIEKEDVNTPAVFGEYIDACDINRGVEDGATVPICYESRLARIEPDRDEKPMLDDEVAELTEDEAQGEQEKLKRKRANVEAVVGAEKRLAMVARDLVVHFENRVIGMDGKAMIVCMSRRICVALYDEIIKLRQEWRSDEDESGVLKIVQPRTQKNGNNTSAAKRTWPAAECLLIEVDLLVPTRSLKYCIFVGAADQPGSYWTRFNCDRPRLPRARPQGRY